jgi:hypothetical protein
MLLYDAVPVVPDAASAVVASRPAGSYVNADVPDASARDVICPSGLYANDEAPADPEAVSTRPRSL